MPPGRSWTRGGNSQRSERQRSRFSASLPSICGNPILGTMGDMRLDIIEVIILAPRAKRRHVEKFWKTNRSCATYGYPKWSLVAAQPGRHQGPGWLPGLPYQPTPYYSFSPILHHVFAYQKGSRGPCTAGLWMSSHQLEP